jgi:hypothetical protein
VESDRADFDPPAPFGGYEQSGLGRESGAHRQSRFEVKTTRR